VEISPFDLIWQIAVCTWHTVSLIMLLVQQFEELNSSVLLGIQRASSELQTQHTVVSKT